MRCSFSRLLVQTSLIVLIAASAVHAQRGGAVRAGMVALPYTVPDASGNQWMIYQQGWFRQQGQMPLFSQGANLMINGNGVNSSNNQGRIDEKTGELVLENMNIAGIVVTRRIFIDRQLGFIRYIEILKNPTPQEMSVGLQFNTNFNYGIQAGLPISDPRNRERQISVLSLQGRAVYEMYATRGAKNIPQMIVQPGNNTVQAAQQVTIPGNKQVAVFHLHGVSTTVDAASQAVMNLKEAQIFAQVPLEIRKILINASNFQSIGDRELLRGDLFDVLESRNGDQIKGTLTEKSYKLTTFYGPVELPAERIVGMFGIGQVRPRQLLVTVDGEVFGGTLEEESLGIQLSSGQTTQVPLAQVSRFGYRKRSGEPEEWTFERPMIVLRSGERMLIAPPTNAIEVMTQYGMLKLKPDSLASIDFQPEDRGIPAVQLSDGSRFAGLATADHFEFQLVGTATQQKVSFPASTVARLQFGKNPDDAPAPDPAVPTLQLTNNDQFTGALSGQIKLDTAFDTITINGSELMSLSHSPEAGFDVQVVLWDQTTLSGQLRDPQLVCNLKSGVTVTVPVPMISKYENPLPKPSDMMVERIKSIVAELGAEDWQRRERAEAQLVTMGSSVVPVLRDVRDSQPLEAQQRIDSVLKQLEKKTEPTPMPQQ